MPPAIMPGSGPTPGGLDVSGSFGGAGGNGGVLIFKDHTSTVNESFYPAYDAQGNVTGLIDTSGNLDAAYEYDPFGKLIRHAGTRRTSMSLLYGTKYTDMETGLIYYGHRYYDPRQGRFINRDPIEEEGGNNLYRFLGNNPVNAIDFLGLCESEGDLNEYDEEICELESVLGPFAIVGEITSIDRNIWAIQDENMERQIEELNAPALNPQNNFNTESGGPGDLLRPSPLTRKGGPLAAFPKPVVRRDNKLAEGYTYFVGLGANIAVIFGIDGNIDVAVYFDGGLLNFDIGLIKSLASQAGVNAGTDVHFGRIRGSLQDQEGPYLFSVATVGLPAPIPFGFTTGRIDNQQSSIDHYRNENTANNPLSSMDSNGWFGGISFGLPIGGGTGYGEAEVWSFRGVIQQMVGDWLNNENADDEEEEEKRD